METRPKDLYEKKREADNFFVKEVLTQRTTWLGSLALNKAFLVKQVDEPRFFTLTSFVTFILS